MPTPLTPQLGESPWTLSAPQAKDEPQGSAKPQGGRAGGDKARRAEECAAKPVGGDMNPLVRGVFGHLQVDVSLAERRMKRKWDAPPAEPSGPPPPTPWSKTTVSLEGRAAAAAMERERRASELAEERRTKKARRKERQQEACHAREESAPYALAPRSPVRGDTTEVPVARELIVKLSDDMPPTPGWGL